MSRERELLRARETLRQASQLDKRVNALVRERAEPVPLKQECPECNRLRDESDFYVERDGRKLRTRPCRYCLREADVKHNREQRRRRT